MNNRSTLVFQLACLYLILAVPVLLIILSVRLVMTPLFLQIEYTRPGFPADFYGLTTAERLTYAPYALNYLIENRPLSYLGDLTFPDGTPLYNARELRHMYDVQVVTQGTFWIGIGSGLLTAIAAIGLLRGGRGDLLRSGLRWGAGWTLMLIVGVVVLVALNWEFFFITFHEVLFVDGTWLFAYSDTLIRLFPEQFWFDAALTIGGLTITGAAVTFLLSFVKLSTKRGSVTDSKWAGFDSAAR